MKKDDKNFECVGEAHEPSSNETSGEAFPNEQGLDHSLRIYGIIQPWYTNWAQNHRWGISYGYIVAFTP